MCVALDEPWGRVKHEEVSRIVDDAIRLYNYTKCKQKYTSLTLSKWQYAYGERCKDLEALQKKMSRAIKQEDLQDIHTQCLNDLKLPQKFSQEAFKLLCNSYGKLQSLYDEVKYREFGWLMNDSCMELNIVGNERQNFTYWFESEAKLAGGVTEYFGVLHDIT